MTTELAARYRFHRAHGGGIVGESARCALDAARAETLLETAVDLGVAAVEWVDDDEPYDHGYYTDEEVREKFASNEWTGPYGCVITVGDDEDDAIASLWGIVLNQWGTSDPYARVVAAELAAELADSLRQAIGDARDAATYDLCDAGHVDPDVKEQSFGRFCLVAGCGADVHERPIDQTWHNAQDNA